MRVFAIGRMIMTIFTTLQYYLIVLLIAYIVAVASKGFSFDAILGIIFAVITFFVVMALRSENNLIEAVQGFWVKEYNVTWLQKSSDRAKQYLSQLSYILPVALIFIGLFFILAAFNGNTFANVKSLMYTFGFHPISTSDLKLFSLVTGILNLLLAPAYYYMLTSINTWQNEISNILQMGSNIIGKHNLDTATKSIVIVQVLTMIQALFPAYILIAMPQFQSGALISYILIFILDLMIVIGLQWFKEYMLQLHKNVKAKSVTVYNTIG